MLYMPKLVKTGSMVLREKCQRIITDWNEQNMNLVHMRILCAKFVKLVQLFIPDPEIFKGWESLKRRRGY